MLIFCGGKREHCHLLGGSDVCVRVQSRGLLLFLRRKQGYYAKENNFVPKKNCSRGHKGGQYYVGAQKGMSV